MIKLAETVAETTKDSSFGIIVHKVEGNIVVLAEGNLEELSDILSVIKEVHGEIDAKIIPLNEEEYNSKKAYISLLNSYLLSKLG